MNSFARAPSGVYDWMAARSMSPVAMCGILKTAERRTACVPFPAPGGPNSRRFSLKLPGRRSGSSAADGARAPCPSAPDARSARSGEPLIVARDEVGFDLLDGIERDTHDDHEAGAAEVERHLHLFVQQRRQHADG